MRDVLTREYGVPVRWVGDEVAQYARERRRFGRDSESRRHQARDPRRPQLRRARAPGPSSRCGHRRDSCAHRIPPVVPTEVGDFLPSPSGLQESYWALYEILGSALNQVLYRLPTRSS